jgi:hypothetical protein
VLCINLDSNQYHLQQSIIAPYISLPRSSKVFGKVNNKTQK